MNHRTIVVFDFETCSKYKDTTEITQIAAEALNPRTLHVVDTFNSESKVLDTNLIQQDALDITGKTREGIAAAPHPEIVWKQFSEFCYDHNTSKTKTTYQAPIPAGYNILGFDMPILERYSKKYGTIDKKSGTQNLFNSFEKIDLCDWLFPWLENTNDLPDRKFDTIRKWMGLSAEGAHDAMIDVSQRS